MGTKIDDWLKNIAKNILLITSFFGVSAKKTMIAWIYIAGFIYAISPNIRLTVADTLFYLICSLFISTLISIYAQYLNNKIEKLNDILPSVDVIVSYKTRLVYLCLWLILATYPSVNDHVAKTVPNMPIITLKILLPLYFWPYFLLNRNIRAKHTLKQWLKDKITETTKFLSPKPIPQPQSVVAKTNALS